MCVCVCVFSLLTIIVAYMNLSDILLPYPLAVCLQYMCEMYALYARVHRAPCTRRCCVEMYMILVKKKKKIIHSCFIIMYINDAL